MAKVTTLLAAGGLASSLLGLMNKPKPPTLPTPAIPPAPAPTRRDDGGARIVVGTDNRNQRVSGGGSSRRSGRSVDILGSLGQGGLNI